MLPWSPRLGVCSWSLRPATPVELVARVREVGVDAVQLALTPLVERHEVWRDAVSRLRDAGIAILSGMLETVGEDYATIARIAETGGVRPDATWPATRERALRVADVAARHDIRLVTFHAGFIPHDRSDPERARMIDRLAQVAMIFGRCGVAIAFETGQEPAATLIDCLKEFAPGTVGVNFDPANMLLYGSGDPISALQALAPWVRQVHLKDARRSPTPGAWGSEVVFGTGEVDVPTFFAALANCPQCPNLVIEREAGDSRVEDCRKARAAVGREDSGWRIQE